MPIKWNSPLLSKSMYSLVYCHVAISLCSEDIAYITDKKIPPEDSSTCTLTSCDDLAMQCTRAKLAYCNSEAVPVVACKTASYTTYIHVYNHTLHEFTDFKPVKGTFPGTVPAYQTHLRICACAFLHMTRYALRLIAYKVCLQRKHRIVPTKYRKQRGK